MYKKIYLPDNPNHIIISLTEQNKINKISRENWDEK